MANKAHVEYKDRETLDSELMSAIGGILSAEAEAKRIIEKAEASVKAIQLDATTRERTLRDAYAKDDAAYRDGALSDAMKRAESDSAEIVAKAEKDGEALVKIKRADIDKIAQELFKSLGSK